MSGVNVSRFITTMRIPGLEAIGRSETGLVTDQGCETLTSGIAPGLFT